MVKRQVWPIGWVIDHGLVRLLSSGYHMVPNSPHSSTVMDGNNVAYRNLMKALMYFDFPERMI